MYEPFLPRPKSLNRPLPDGPGEGLGPFSGGVSGSLSSAGSLDRRRSHERFCFGRSAGSPPSLSSNHGTPPSATARASCRGESPAIAARGTPATGEVGSSSVFRGDVASDGGERSREVVAPDGGERSEAVVAAGGERSGEVAASAGERSGEVTAAAAGARSSAAATLATGETAAGGDDAAAAPLGA